jgi:hypothetical protein
MTPRYCWSQREEWADRRGSRCGRWCALIEVALWLNQSATGFACGSLSFPTLLYRSAKCFLCLIWYVSIAITLCSGASASQFKKQGDKPALKAWGSSAEVRNRGCQKECVSRFL